MRPGQLVIVDEASLAGTLHLDQLFTQARAAGAKLLLVGDHQQLSSVDAGGAFRLLASTPGARELTSLWRFRRRWEATASRRLRAGDPTVIDTYTAHDRIQAGPGEVMVEAAYRGWTTAETAGRSALLLAPDARTVAVLNARAHDDHVATGAVTGPYTPIADGVQVGVGDRVVTRANDRRLRTSEGGFVRNGDLWHITAVHPDGALTLVPAGHYQPRTTPHAPAVSVVVPGEYVRANVELGYASTIHRAQGITVEQALVLLTPGMGRQGLYVAMTRGRALNRVYVATDVPDPDCDTPPDPGRDQTPVEILTRVLANDTAERAATQVLRDAQDHAGSLARLVPIRDSLLADADTRRWTRALPTAGLTPDQVRHVQASPAAGALYTALRKVEADGHNPVRVLRGVLAARPTADADDLASVLHQRVTDWHQDQPPPQQTADPASRALRALRVTPAPIDRADPAGPVLAEIDDAIRNRIQNLTLEQVDVRPAWMAPLGEPPTDNPDDTARWRQAVATLAAYRDLHQLADTQPVDTGADPGTRDRIGDQQHRLARHAQRTATRLGRHGPTRTPDRSPTR